MRPIQGRAASFSYQKRRDYHTKEIVVRVRPLAEAGGTDAAADKNDIVILHLKKEFCMKNTGIEYSGAERGREGAAG